MPTFASTNNGERRVRAAAQPLEVVLLFIGTLGISTWSMLALLTPIAWNVVLWTARPVVRPAFAARLALLATFAATFFVITGWYGFYARPTDPLKLFIVVVGLYAMGCAAGTDSPSIQIWKLLALVGGFVTFAFLGVHDAILSGNYLDPELTERAGTNYFRSESLIAATGLGALGSLGMCLLPALFARSSRDQRAAATVPWRAAAAGLVVMGWLANLALQNRTPIIAMAGAAFASALVVATDPRSSSRARVAAAVAAIAVAALAVGAGPLLSAMPDHPAVRRFQEEGLETERYAVWVDVARALPRYPFGGRKIDLRGFGYAHNLWLDVGYDSGMFPLLLLAGFHASHVGVLFRAIRANTSGILRLTLVGLCASFFATFMVEPILQFRVDFFAASCFLLGMATAIGARPAPRAECALEAVPSRSCAS